MEVIHTIGRRKTSVARVFMSKGKGELLINNKKISDYFTTENLQFKVLQPFILTNTEKVYNLKISLLIKGHHEYRCKTF